MCKIHFVLRQSHSDMMYILRSHIEALITFYELQEDQESVIPSFLPLSSEHISNEGIYLLENGHDCLIYFGDTVSSDILQRLFGVATVDEIPTLVISSLSFSFLSGCLVAIIHQNLELMC